MERRKQKAETLKADMDRRTWGQRRDIHALLPSEFPLSAVPRIANEGTVVKKSQHQCQLTPIKVN
jgi:hypothetical protein